VTLANEMNAHTWGVDASATALLLPQWRVHGSYIYLHETFTFDPGSRDPTGGVNEYNDPSRVLKLRSNVDLPGGIELDAFIRRVARLPHPVVPAYAEMDARIGWRPSADWEVSLIGQNLLHSQHREFQLAGPTHEEFERGAYVRLLWRY
jgi:iron complex outermembrane receptor protein